MFNAFRSGKFAVVAVLATALVGLPQMALAKDHCRNNGNGRNGREAYSNQYRGSRNDRYNSYGQSRNNSYYRNDSYRNNDPYYYGEGYGYPEQRSAGKSAAIIGGGAAAGAAVGAITGGTKGALIGAAVGGVGGLIYDRTTRNKRSGW
jgi:hypothetical protein